MDMREHMITYSDLKLDSSKHGDKVRQKEMTTYSELKFQNQAEQQRGRRFQEAGSRSAGGSPSPSKRHKGWLLFLTSQLLLKGHLWRTAPCEDARSCLLLLEGHKQREQARCPFSSSSSELLHPPLVNGEEQDKDCLF